MSPDIVFHSTKGGVMLVSIDGEIADEDQTTGLLKALNDDEAVKEAVADAYCAYGEDEIQ